MARSGTFSLTGEFIAESAGGSLLQGEAIRVVGGASIDSRTLLPGQVFFAIKGPRHDGHDFLRDAIGRGASGLVVERRKVEKALELTKGTGDRIFVVAVDDTEMALREAARAWVDVMGPVVVAITGSVGKSTTKDLCAAVARAKYATHSTPANLNNIYGVSLTCLGLEPRHEVLVLEMGTSGPGEIRRLCNVARPRVSVVTAVAPAHIEGLGSLEGVAAAKAEILEPLSEDGFAVLNGDDPRVRAMQSLAKAKCILFGTNEDCDVRVIEAEVTAEARTKCRLHLEGRDVVTYLALLGNHQAYNAAAAMAVALALKIEPEVAAHAMEQVQPAKHRLNLINSGSVLCLDDCYNASPRSMSAALNVFSKISGNWRRRVAILGDMRELGELAESAHKEVGAQAARSGVSLLVAAGRYAEHVKEGALLAGMPSANIVVAPDALAALEVSAALLRPGDIVLVKGSRALGLEIVVDWIVQNFGMTEEIGN